MKDSEIEYVNNLFEQPWWLDIVAPDAWKDIVIEEKGEVIGRLPYCYKGKTIGLPPLTQTCGIWIKRQQMKPGNENLSYIKKIIDQLFEQLCDFKNVIIALDTSAEYFLPFLWKGFSVYPRISYRIENLEDMNAVYANFSKTVKKNIKSAEKKVTISTDSDIDVLLKIMDKTFAAQGRKYPVEAEIVSKIVKECDRRGNGKMFTARDGEGNVHACSYFVYDKHVFYYLIAGSDSEFRSSGAQTLILWEAIQYASKVSRVFDFEGSMVEGIETFFRRFGGKPVVYYEIRKESVVKEIMHIMKPRVKRFLGYKI